MAKTQSTFPTTIDTTLQTDRSSGDAITSASYDVIEDGLFELETKIGVDSSAVATSLDYLVKSTSSTDPGHTHTGTFQKCRVYRNAAWSVPATAFTKVPMDTDDYDPSNISDLGNNRITPTKAGYYQVSGQIAVPNLNQDEGLLLAIYVNGAVASYGNRIYASILGPIYPIVSDLVYLDGDDYVELWAYASVAEALSVGSKVWTYFSLVGPF